MTGGRGGGVPAPDYRWMTLDRLRAFVVAVAAGTLSGAAREMYVSQPALSQRIFALEESLGTRLLERGPRGVTPTPEGAAFHAAAVSVLEGMEEVEERVRQWIAGERGHVRVAATVSLGSYLLAPSLYGFRAAHPAIDVTLLVRSEREVEEAVALGDVAVSCTFGDPSRPAPATTAEAGAVELVPVCGSSQPWDAGVVALDESCATAERVECLLEESGLGALPVLFRADQPEAVKRYLMSRPGFAFLPEPAVRSEVRSGMLRSLVLVVPSVRVPVLVSCTSAPPPDFVRLVFESVVEAVSGGLRGDGCRSVDAERGCC
ncbi:MAG: LysR family transcriptional regulator [Thermoleophilia bacterium]